jgi:hypothetical protein
MTDNPIETKPARFAKEDAVALLGLSLLIAGIAWIYRPAALIVLGALLLVYAFVLAAKHKAESQSGREG